MELQHSALSRHGPRFESMLENSDKRLKVQIWKNKYLTVGECTWANEKFNWCKREHVGKLPAIQHLLKEVTTDGVLTLNWNQASTAMLASL